MRKKDPGNEMQLPFEGESFKAAWDEWLRYRSERRLPKYVPTGLKKTFTNLLKISGNNVMTAIDIINQSIENNWQGLFPVKNQVNGAYKQPSSAERRADKFRNFVAKGQAAYDTLIAARGKENPAT